MKMETKERSENIYRTINVGLRLAFSLRKGSTLKILAVVDHTAEVSSLTSELETNLGNWERST